MNTLLTLVRHTDNAQMNFVTVEVCQLGGAAIIFPESWNFQLKIFLLNPFGEKMTSMYTCSFGSIFDPNTCQGCKKYKWETVEISSEYLKIG